MKRYRKYKYNFHLKLRLQSWIPSLKVAVLIYALSMAVVLYITVFELKLLQTELLVKDIKRNGIDYDAFREFKVTDDLLRTAGQRIAHIVKQNPELQNKAYIDVIGYLTYNMMSMDYNPTKQDMADVETFIRGITKLAGTQSFKELYEYYSAILTDLRYFPVPMVESEDADISYTDSWYVLRKYGGNRRHEGVDLMASNHVRGFFPIISITDGVVENMGWLEQGGYRIGIRSKSGGYFYYAHLHSYAPELKSGDQVIAGQLLGFMGDSGYGSEGTIGQFDVHLHLGIYVKTSLGDMSVNPYWILRLLEENRTRYQYNEKNFES